MMRSHRSWLFSFIDLAFIMVMILAWSQHLNNNKPKAEFIQLSIKPPKVLTPRDPEPATDSPLRLYIARRSSPDDRNIFKLQIMDGNSKNTTSQYHYDADTLKRELLKLRASYAPPKTPPKLALITNGDAWAKDMLEAHIVCADIWGLEKVSTIADAKSNH